MMRMRKAVYNRGGLIAMALMAALSASLMDVPAYGAEAQAPQRGPWPSPLPSVEPRFGTVKQLNVPVMMSDGVQLTVDISYPADKATGKKAAGRFPVLLTQTPYLNADPASGDYFVERGYIYVTAYVRGTTKSDGEYGFFADRDAKDGAELVRWAASRLAGSSGVIGLHGGSYMGITQLFTLAKLGKGSPVKALQASCMGAEFYRETYFAGGVPSQTLNFQRVIQGAMGKNTGLVGAALVTEIEGGASKAYFDDFWKSRTTGNLVPALVDADVPIMLWSSDGDIYAQSSLSLYAYLQNAFAGVPIYGPMSADAKPSGRYQIFMSQGGHCANQDPRVQLAWYDTWLKGADFGMAQTQTPIHVHQLVSDAWIDIASYPGDSRYSQYFLGQNGTFRTSAEKSGSVDQLVWAQPGPESQLLFGTAPMTHDMVLAGPVGASIMASSSTKNLLLIATLELALPDGSTKKLTSGTILGSLSQNDPARSWKDASGAPIQPYGTYDRDRYVAPGKMQRYDFAISPRYAQLPAGSRLMLRLTTQTPIEACKPVLGTDPCFPTALQTATLTGARFKVYRGGKNSSYINLPLVPR